MMPLVFAFCLFLGVPIVNCEQHPPAVVQAWIERFEPCAVYVPEEHRELVRAWQIGTAARGGRSTYTPPMVRLGQRASCKVMAHEIGHQVQRALRLPGDRERFAREYARRAMAGLRPLWDGASA